MKKEIQLRCCRLLKILPLAALLLPLAFNSCAVHENSRQFAPGASESRINSLKTFYVRNEAEDKAELATDITSELKAMGYKATTGTSQSSRADAVITFNDKWMWDITMYMLSLEIQVREPGSDAVFASAKTVRTSMIRKSQKEMVQETLTKLLKNP